MSGIEFSRRAPYRVRKSGTGNYWLWSHHCPKRFWPAHGRAATWKLAMFKARCHALTHILDGMKPTRYAFGGEILPSKSEYTLIQDGRKLP